jgi:hypothetical protein
MGILAVGIAYSIRANRHGNPQAATTDAAVTAT